MLTLAHPLPLKRPVKRTQVIKPKCAVDPVQLSATVGKGLTLWVLFTSTLNWMYYRKR